MPEYVKLGQLDVYKSSLKISFKSWQIYQNMDWEAKKVIGNQFIRAIDSMGANIAEGYGRFHYLDKIRFYYNARGSLLESKHWLWLLKVRGIIEDQEFHSLIKDLDYFHYQLNQFINSTYQAKHNKEKER